MPFDVTRFEQAQFRHRTRDIDVPELAGFFAEGEKPVWRVRGLSGIEMQQAADAGARRKNVGHIIEAIAAGGDQVKALRESIGMPGAVVPAEVVRRQEMLQAGSVEPAIDLALAVKLSEMFPIAFLRLTNEIAELTGLGGDLVKPAAASQPTTPCSTA